MTELQLKGISHLEGGNGDKHNVAEVLVFPQAFRYSKYIKMQVPPYVQRDKSMTKTTRSASL